MCFNRAASENKNILSSAFLCGCLGRWSNISNVLDHFLLQPQSSLFWRRGEDPCLVLTSVLIEASWDSRLLSPSAFYSSLMFRVNVDTKPEKFSLNIDHVLNSCRRNSWVFCILRRIGTLRNHYLSPECSSETTTRQSRICLEELHRTNSCSVRIYVCYGRLYQQWHKKGLKQYVNYI